MDKKQSSIKNTRTFVSVLAKYDINGIMTPVSIEWIDNRVFYIDRILHISDDAEDIVNYLVLIKGLQRNLYKNGNRWYVYS